MKKKVVMIGIIVVLMAMVAFAICSFFNYSEGASVSMLVMVISGGIAMMIDTIED